MRNVVHALHDESERQEPHQWTAAWRRGAPSPFAIDGRGQTADLEVPASELLVRILGQLRIATTQYAVGLRSDGAPPEEMLVRVKELMRIALTDEGWWDREAARSLTAAMVVWSIDAYYGR